MSDRDTLALAFITLYPQAAANTLLALPTRRVVTFLQQLPMESLAGVIQHLPPAKAVEFAQTFPQPVYLELLECLPAKVSASLLRGLSVEQRDSRLGMLKKKTQASLKPLLKYPADRLGAWVMTQIFVLKSDSSAGESRRRLRQTRLYVPYRLLVVDDAEKLLGWVLMNDLLRASQSTPIHQLPLQSVSSIAARSLLAKAIEHKDWQRFSEMPVVDKEKSFLGIVTQEQLLQAIQQSQQHDRDETGHAPELTDLGQLFVDAVGGAWHTSLDLFDTSSSNREESS